MVAGIPASFREWSKDFHITKIDRETVSNYEHFAKWAHSPENGVFGGLDGEEIKFIKKYLPERAKEYEKLAKCAQNEYYLYYDRDTSKKTLEKAKCKYNNLKGKWFTKLFHREEYDKYLKIAKWELDNAQREYDGAMRKVIASRTFQHLTSKN